MTARSVFRSPPSRRIKRDAELSVGDASATGTGNERRGDRRNGGGKRNEGLQGRQSSRDEIFRHMRQTTLATRDNSHPGRMHVIVRSNGIGNTIKFHRRTSQMIERLNAVECPRQTLSVVGEQPVSRSLSFSLVELSVAIFFRTPPPSFEDGELFEDDFAENARGETVENVQRSRRGYSAAFDDVVTAWIYKFTSISALANISSISPGIFVKRDNLG